MFMLENFTRSAHRSKTFSTALEVSFTGKQLPIKNMTELCVEVYELWWKWDFRFMFSEYRLVEEKGSCTFCKKKHFSKHERKQMKTWNLNHKLLIQWCIIEEQTIGSLRCTLDFFRNGQSFTFVPQLMQKCPIYTYKYFNLDLKFVKSLCCMLIQNCNNICKKAGGLQHLRSSHHSLVCFIFCIFVLCTWTVDYKNSANFLASAG